MIYETARHMSPAPHTDASPVLGTDANGNTETTTLGAAASFRQPEEGIAGFLARGWIVADYVAPEPGPYRLFKSVFIRRMIKNEEVNEAAIMEAVLAGADAKLRLMFNSVEYFVSDDELFGTLVGAVGAVLGEERAGELLAAEAT